MELSVVCAVLVGAVLKKKLQGEMLRKAIPVFIFISQFIGRLVLEVQPAEAAAFSAVFAKLAPSLFDIARESFVSTLLGVGAHSTWKNAGKQFVDAAKSALVKKALGEPDQPQ